MKRHRNALRRVAAGIAKAAAFAWTGLAATVTNVRGIQREKSRLVDVYYDLEATDGGTYTVSVEMTGRTNEVTASTFSGDVGKGITPGRNHHIVWNAGADWPGKKGDVRAVVTATKEPEKEKPGKGVQLWEGGPYWADRNIGASAPEDSGLYFWWGDTVGCRPSSDGTFDFDFSDTNSAIYTYCGNVTLQNEGWIVSTDPGSYVLSPSHDAAYVQWGGAWRMPTYQELDDLCNKCDWTWATINGVNGYVVRGKGAYASNSIFLPAAGYGYGASLIGSGSYWSSDRSRWFFGWSYALEFTYGVNNYHMHVTDSSCYDGLPVRPVQGFTN